MTVTETTPADDFVTIYVTRPSPIHLPRPKNAEAGASGVDKDMLLPGANRVRRSFLAAVSDNPGLKIFWKARLITFDPPPEIAELGDLRARIEERRAAASETTGPSADVNPFSGKTLPEALAYIQTADDALALSRLMDVDPRSEIRTAIARRVATLGSR